jgi:hypothetical protein
VPRVRKRAPADFLRAPGAPGAPARAPARAPALPSSWVVAVQLQPPTGVAWGQGRGLANALSWKHFERKTKCRRPWSSDARGALGRVKSVGASGPIGPGYPLLPKHYERNEQFGLRTPLSHAIRSNGDSGYRERADGVRARPVPNIFWGNCFVQTEVGTSSHTRWCGHQYHPPTMFMLYTDTLASVGGCTQSTGARIARRWSVVGVGGLFRFCG